MTAELEKGVRMVLDAGLATGHADTWLDLLREVLDQVEDLRAKTGEKTMSTYTAQDVRDAALAGEAYVTCPCCEHPHNRYDAMGFLGNTLWFRCRACGINFCESEADDGEGEEL